MLELLNINGNVLSVTAGGGGVCVCVTDSHHLSHPLTY